MIIWILLKNFKKQVYQQKKNFTQKLNDENITNENYSHAQHV